MKAIRIHKFGGPEVLQLEKIDPPRPSPGEVLLKIQAAGVNPIDAKIREGQFPLIGQSQLPIILGRDVCGAIEAINGSAANLAAGDMIFALLDWHLGGYAQYALVAASLCSKRPPTLDVEHAAAVPLAALTAWQGIFTHGKLKAGQTVLIHGGSGGVGHFAIQLAKHFGAHVIATASKANITFVSSLGAHTVIDYQKSNFEEIGKEVDVVFDLVGGETQKRSWTVLKPGGILVSTLGKPDEKTANSLGVRCAGFMAEPNREQLDNIAALIATGKVVVTVSKIFELKQAGEAHRALGNDHPRGKLSLSV
ncbi:MAG TPA: NADP-dependent oxidoreductase [Steroidobacteraceae bacterium]|jgi:NADPH:quinone reductase-like Zn-dependent oxidoreductase|nr:NADP-dependent oxidoreductase [Steroidobacteraceae bacterium]